MYHLNGPLRGGGMLTRFHSMGPWVPWQGKAHGMSTHWAVLSCVHSGFPAGPRPHTHLHSGLQGSLGGQTAPLGLPWSPPGRHEGLEAAYTSGGRGWSEAQTALKRTLRLDSEAEGLGPALLHPMTLDTLLPAALGLLLRQTRGWAGWSLTSLPVLTF